MFIMSSAIHNLQKAILDANQSLTQLLRQTKLIAAKLNLADVEQWVDYELKGYPGDLKPPEYRRFQTSALQIHNPIHGWQFAGNMRMSLLARQPIAQLESLSKGETATFNMPKNLPVDDGMGGGFAANWS